MTVKITIEDTGDVYPCAETKHLLAGMIQLGKKGIPVGCRSGGCGVCKVQVLSGDYTSKKMSRDHVTEEEEGRGIVLACRVFPQSDITLSVIGHLRKAVMR
ncbi:MAG: 2Fe-2S iron-sulfur cluster-binding protein [Cycloclasticus sp.]